MRILPLVLAALLVCAPPALAQDWLKPLQDLANDLVPPREAPRQTAPRPPTPPVAPSVPTPSIERPIAPEAAAPAAAAEEAPPLPRPRPEEQEAAPQPETPAPASAAPEPASDRIYQAACPALLSGKVVGEMLPPIAEGICGERSPLSLTAIRANGHEIALSAPVTTNCAMAGALADWAGDVDAYARAALESPVATLTTGTSLMCRDRVGGDETAMSEHGFANALDVVGVTLENGTAISVKADWGDAGAPAGKFLRQAHGAACGLFTTVLGPEANAEHEDHLHLDLGCHGKTCMAQICE